MEFGSRNTAFLAWHLGLGDAIAFSNLAIEMANRFDKLILPVWERNYFAIREIFEDRNDVMLMPFSTHEDYSYFIKLWTERKRAILLGNYSHDEVPKYHRSPGQQFLLDPIHWIYQTVPSQLAVNVAQRWNTHQIQERVDTGDLDFMDVPSVPYIFVHEDVDRGFRIRPDALPDAYFRVHPTSDGHSILKWAQILIHAEEIHVIDSSFFHLAEALSVKASRVVLHRYAREVSEGLGEYHNTRQPWIIKK